MDQGLMLGGKQRLQDIFEKKNKADKQRNIAHLAFLCVTLVCSGQMTAMNLDV